MRRRVFAPSCLLALTLASAAPAAAATASLVADLATGPNLPFHLDESLFTLAGKALFLADGEVLWRSDGTTAGTEPFFDVCAEEDCQNSAMILGVAGRSLFITAGDRLWATDGTRAGTVSLAPPGIRRDSFTLTSKHLFFHACDSAECALWKSDGTVAGTVRVGKADLDYLYPVGDSVFFVHSKLGSGPEIAELWHAEGSDTAGAAGPPGAPPDLPGPRPQPQRHHLHARGRLAPLLHRLRGRRPWLRAVDERRHGRRHPPPDRPAGPLPLSPPSRS